MIKNRQYGSALLTALFMMTLVSIIATAMTTRLQRDIHRITSILTIDRLQLASQAVNFWAMDSISDPKQDLQRLRHDGSLLHFPKALKALDPNIILSGQLFDLQARLNVNNLYEPNYQAIFLRLLFGLNREGLHSAPQNILEAIINAIQAPPNNPSQDKWYDRYARQIPRYFPSYMPMQHLSELRLVYGISAHRYLKLQAYLAALPQTTAINVNTAPKALLMALAIGITDIDMAHILQQRQQQPYTVDAIKPFLNKYHIPVPTVTVESSYFLVVARAATGAHSLSIYTILQRQKDKSGIWHVSILGQSLNTL